jgi:uncharacterized protein YjbI with pentapeptide repeats
MTSLTPLLGDDFGRKLELLMDSDEENFVALTKLLSLTPAHDYIATDLSGCDFSDCDLAGYNFSRCDLRGVHYNEATSFAGAILDGAKLDAELRQKLGAA